MPYRIADYRKRAEFCREQAQVSVDQETQRQWLLLAKSWEDFADSVVAASKLKVVASGG